MYMDRFLCGRSRAVLSHEERALLEAGVDQVMTPGPRQMIVRAGETLSHSTMVVDGYLCRYFDDRRGMRQLVALHVPGDFVDLHAYPLATLDHDIATLTQAKIATVPHAYFDKVLDGRPELARKLWYSTLLDAAIHRAWLFRLGRLDAGGRIAHFLCETNARLEAVGLSDGRDFALGITQADLSEICGLTSIHINRVLRGLREEKIVSFRGGQVEILDPTRLQRRAEFDPGYLYLSVKALARLPGDTKPDSPAG